VSVLPFLGVAAVVIVTPGVDMALVTRNALLRGRRAGLASAAGVTVGNLFWTVAAALGLAAIVAASAAAFTVVKIAGAVFLVYLGLKALRGSEAPVVRATGSSFRQGLASNLLNPKIAVFFTSLLPQFVGTRASALDLIALGALFSFMGLGWLCVYALVVARSGDVLRRPRARRVLDRVTGVVLIGLGVRLVLERRPS
jgi:threonine/homoserine/homoserine lactone efflux protein